MSRLRFAVIGCGRMGRRRAQSVARNPHADLVVVADHHADHARDLAARHGCAAARGSEEVLDRPDVDCVILSVPNRAHRDLAVDLLRRGRHVFCEKPLACDPVEARDVLEAARRSRGTLKVGSNLRYFPNVQKARELLLRGAVGEPLFLRSWIGHDGWNHQSWYGQAEVAGGGTFLDNGAHLFDLVRWLLGEVASCQGTVGTGMWPVAPLEDNGFGLFQTVEGRTAVVHSSWTEWAGYMHLELYGREGYLQVDCRRGACRTVLAGRSGPEEVFDFADLPGDSYQAEMDDYVRALLEGRPPEPGAWDGLRSVEMAHAVYESHRTGRRVDLTPRPVALPEAAEG